MGIEIEKVEYSRGQRCPACCSTDRIRTKGILINKSGRYGSFLGCSRYPNCKYSCKEVNLHQQANKLLKRKR